MGQENFVVELEGVDFRYNGDFVLDDVNLQLREGECVCVVGPNGGGKTTLLKIILGLLKPERGRVRVFGRSPKEALGKVSYMSQFLNVDGLFPVRVFDVVCMGRLDSVKYGGRYSREDKLGVGEILEKLGIEGLKNELLSELSGGQRQRVMIARALVGDPELLLMDEPTNNIDVQVEMQLIKLLHEYKEQMTIIMVTHDLGFVSSMVKKVICVNRTVSMHPTAEVKDNLLRGVYGTDIRLVRHDQNLSMKEDEEDKSI